jgi:hypothetical protein
MGRWAMRVLVMLNAEVQVVATMTVLRGDLSGDRSGDALR